MRRIARIIARLNVGGPAIQAASLSRWLEEFGFETLLVFGQLSPGEGDMRYLLAADTATDDVPTLGREVSPWRDLRAFWHIYRSLCRFRPDIVHTHTAKAGALGRLAAVVYNQTAGRRQPARLVHTYHGHVFDGYFGSTSTKLFIAIERWLARRSDALVAISSRVAQDLSELYRIGQPHQIRVVPLGFDLSSFTAIEGGARRRARTDLEIPAGRTIVTTVGRLTEIKRHDLFLEMAAILVARNPTVDFLIVGDGERRQPLEELARARGLDGRVRFLSWRTDLSTIYAASDVFVLTSRNEGTPVALIEAMAAGVPGVSTDVGGVRDVITDPTVGLVVPFGEPALLAAGVERLLGSVEERQTMGSRARDAVTTRFHLQRLLGDIAGLYEELLASRRTSPAPESHVL